MSVGRNLLVGTKRAELPPVERAWRKQKDSVNSAASAALICSAIPRKKEGNGFLTKLMTTRASERGKGKQEEEGGGFLSAKRGWTTKARYKNASAGVTK